MENGRTCIRIKKYKKYKKYKKQYKIEEESKTIQK
jgi:hypothetical protein